jgi:hypothetical protein
MLIKISFLMLLVGFVLVGCSRQMLDGSRDHQPCDTASCAISVSVDSNCVVNVDKPDLDVKNNPTADITLQWNIAPSGSTSGYTFSSTNILAPPIFLKSGNPHQAFHQPSVSSTGNALTVQFKKGGSGKHQHEYALSVVDANNNVCATVDPFIYE